ncbi:MAG TPA: TetR family transcriptional regulator [Pseudonocardiaceae bacterium]|jgi:AcrR family transcriptional regulator|nr:TetR family transcriptional regulator [Pseudonocardiaceae bacterium]
MADGAPTTARKSDATRTLILDTALRLFADRGYERTTMRGVATEAGVSVGNAYYYFDSKEHLVQGFYDRISELHVQASRAVLDTETELGARLHGVLSAWLDIATPYHRFGPQFFRNAANPESPLSPFSPESAPARELAIGVLREVADGSAAKMDPKLRPELPELLWIYQMGIVLYWVHDRSAGQRRTRALLDRTVPLIDRAVGLSRLRVMRPLIAEAVSVVNDLLYPEPPAH